MCDHRENKAAVFIEGLSLSAQYEVYMCECGVLIDILDDKNLGSAGPVYPMNAMELEALTGKLFGELGRPIAKDWIQ